MHELITAIKAWPIIVQGALGSALFWVILFFSQKSADRISLSYSKYSTQRRRRWLVSERIKCLAAISPTKQIQSANLILLIYRTMRPLTSALLWLAFGLFLQVIDKNFAYIGFIGCIYYTFTAMQLLAPIRAKNYNKAKLQELESELSKLRER